MNCFLAGIYRNFFHSYLDRGIWKIVLPYYTFLKMSPPAPFLLLSDLINLSEKLIVTEMSNTLELPSKAGDQSGKQNPHLIFQQRAFVVENWSHRCERAEGTKRDHWSNQYPYRGKWQLLIGLRKQREGDGIIKTYMPRGRTLAVLTPPRGCNEAALGNGESRWTLSMPGQRVPVKMMVGAAASHPTPTRLLLPL